MIPIIIAAVAGVLVGALIGIFSGIAYRKKVAEAEIGSAEKHAAKIVEEAKAHAESMSKEALLSTKEEILRQRNEAEQELKDRRSEVARMERRNNQKEEFLDKKTEALEKKSEQLDRKIHENEVQAAKIEEVLSQHIVKLEEISGYSVQQAKDELLATVESETKHELAQKLDELEAQFKEEADAKAKDILSLAIQRCAADHVSEIATSSIAIPSDEMKGRIIGREGRNIKSIEQATGVEILIDDTPETITISGFDPVRREVARLAIEKLISDGRIHPARIEEMVDKAQHEVDAIIKQSGDRATYEVGVHGINPELVRLLGRLRYRTSFGQNVLKHSIEVAFLAGMMADELGVDGNAARRAGLLHDIGKAFPQDCEGTHVQLGAEAAKKYKEKEIVVNAIEAHHGDVAPKSIVAVLVAAADAVSAARPGARREDMANYIKRLEKLEEIAKGHAGVDKAYAIQAGREVRVILNPDTTSDEDMKLVTREIAKKYEEELKYPGTIKVISIRESRQIEYAK